MFQKGNPGRPKGAKNKIKTPFGNILQELGGPDGKFYADQLFRLACEPHDDPNVRVRALAIIAPYVWQKLPERQEISGPDGGPIEVHDHFALPAPADR